MTTVSKSQFKARALEFFRQVQRSGKPVVITDRKVPVLKLVPYREDPTEAMRAARTEALPFVQFVPVDNRIALRAVDLAEFPHRDLADRMIVSTALEFGAPLVTGDERLRGYRRVTTLWA